MLNGSGPPWGASTVGHTLGEIPRRVLAFVGLGTTLVPRRVPSSRPPWIPLETASRT